MTNLLEQKESYFRIKVLYSSKKKTLLKTRASSSSMKASDSSTKNFQLFSFRNFLFEEASTCFRGREVFGWMKTRIRRRIRCFRLNFEKKWRITGDVSRVNSQHSDDETFFYALESTFFSRIKNSKSRHLF